MSVLIRGMEMPECCYDCPFIRASFAGDYYCAKGKGDEDDLKKLYSQRMADCPLVEIPTPHGRLIDGDAYIKMMEEKCDHELSLDEWVLKVCRGGVSIMPTVIEAEGREE